jgi:endonuclease/exonuclease/phosphatase family metal-dependent hydrolase
MRVGTYNIYNTTGRYLEGRRELLLDAVHHLEADILGLQELASGQQQPHGQDQVEDLKQLGWEVVFAQLPEPIVQYEEANDDMFRIDGNAIAVRRNSGTRILDETHEVLHFKAQSSNGSARLAHRVEVDIEGQQRVLVVNTHLHWAEKIEPSTDDALLRGAQTAELVEWAFAGANGLPILILGDFNFYQKTEPSYDHIRAQNFESAFKLAHGHETITCPTPLQADTMLDQWDEDLEDKLAADYIFFHEGDTGMQINVEAATLATSSATSAADDPTLYPSDHYAVVANLTYAIPAC